MRKLRALWRMELLRPTLYRCVTKCAVALAAVLVYDRFFSANGAFSVLGDGTFIAGAVLLAAAWTSYLRLDGLGITPPVKEERKHRRHWTADPIDFVDEHVVTWEELSEPEQRLCGLLSSLAAGFLFLLPSLIALAV